MTTGEKIACCRKRLGLTQARLAAEMGVTRQAVSRWESDLAFPETEKLIMLSKLFGCSADWLLNYRSGEEFPEEEGEDKTQDAPPLPDARGEGVRLTLDLKRLHFEYKSAAHIGKLPLVHVNIGWGRVAKGVISVGLCSVGVLSVGLLSLGVFAVGLLALGLIALGDIAAGVLSAGAVSFGVIALGAVAIGLFSMGGCAVGLFAFGGYAAGYYVAIGDKAVGGIAVGETSARGSVLSVMEGEYGLMRSAVYAKLEEIPRVWALFTAWSRSIFSGLTDVALNIKVKT